MRQQGTIGDDRISVLVADEELYHTFHLCRRSLAMTYSKFHHFRFGDSRTYMSPGFEMLSYILAQPTERHRDPRRSMSFRRAGLSMLEVRRSSSTLFALDLGAVLRIVIR